MGGGSQYHIGRIASSTDKGGKSGNGGMELAGQHQVITTIHANPPNINKALVLAKQQEEPLLSDEFGTEMVTIVVGAEQIPFPVHKDLLFSVAPIFEEHFGVAHNPTDRISIKDEHPTMFRLFVNYMYTKQIAVVTAAMSDLQQSSRTRDLCQLFVFAERFYLPHKFSNQILDAIQDAFFLTGKLPDYGLITGIYKYTGGSSKLRSFVAHCLVFGIRSESFSCYDNVGLLLQQNGDLMADFISALKIFVPDHDPRLRDCRGDPGCLECVNGRVPLSGYWPCAFHIHNMVRSKNPSTTGTSGPIVFQDASCYLWRE